MNCVSLVLMMALMAATAWAGGEHTKYHNPDNVDEVRAILLLYDKDGDNKVSKEEGITGMMSHDATLTKEAAIANAEKLIKQYDTNGDGAVSLSELEKLFGL